MLISKERLLHESQITGFRSEILEKVIVLVHLLQLINKDTYLKERLVLKGGTALNLFYHNAPKDLVIHGEDVRRIRHQRISFEVLLAAQYTGE